MERLHAKTTLTDFSDRELMLLILSNQVKIYREVQYIRQFQKDGKVSALGHYSESFKELIRSADSILEQSDEYLKGQN